MARNVTVVTGGASGIGLACAKALGKYGPVVISGRYEDRLQAASKALTDLGIENYYMVADSSDLRAVQALADFAVSKGEIKNIVNSAGISGDSPDATTRRVLEIDALGTVNAVKCFYPLLGKDSVQINISSMGRFTAVLWGITEEQVIPHFANWAKESFVDDVMQLIPDNEKGPDMAYSLSKIFVYWFSMKNVRRYADKGARIVTISPGHYNTRMMQRIAECKPEITEGMRRANPMGRWGEPEEIGALAEFICGPSGTYLNGIDILTDGGFTVANISQREEQLPSV